MVKNVKYSFRLHSNITGKPLDQIYVSKWIKKKLILFYSPSRNKRRLLRNRQNIIAYISEIIADEHSLDNGTRNL